MALKLKKIKEQVPSLLKVLKEDLLQVEKLYREKMPKRFPKVKGFRVESRYIAGAASGGDYFDLLESKAEVGLAVVLSHVSTYKFSTALMDELSQLGIRATQKDNTELLVPQKFTQALLSSLAVDLGERDQWSWFCGLYSLKNSFFQYLSYGNHVAYYAEPNQKFKLLENQKTPFSKTFPPMDPDFKLATQQIKLSAKGKLVLVSNGFVQALGGISKLEIVLEEFRKKESLDLLTEFAFQTKEKIDPEIGMPEIDCTAVVIEVGAALMGLAKT